MNHVFQFILYFTLLLSSAQGYAGGCFSKESPERERPLEERPVSLPVVKNIEDCTPSTFHKIFDGHTLSDGSQIPLDLIKEMESYLHLNLHPENSEITRLYNAALKGDDKSASKLAKYYSNNKNYTEAIFWLKIAAEKGNAEAQLFLGERYYLGQGTNKNYGKALKYLILSTTKNHPNLCLSYTNLAGMYMYGLGVSMDFDRAIKHYEKAISLGNSSAKLPVAVMLLLMKRSESDIKKALSLLTEESTAGDLLAKRWLGVAYEFGYGVDIDLDVALQFYHSAAFHQNNSVRDWLGQGASGENPISNIDLGIWHVKGTIYEVDEKEAVEYFKKAEFKLEGPNTPENISAFLVNIGRAADKNNADVIRLIQRALTHTS